MARILILGGGFGGLTAAEKLADSLGAEHQITLISLKPEFVFYPALTHVAFGNLQPDDVKFDLRAKLSDLDVRFVQGEVIGIDTVNQTVKIFGDDFSGNIHYDYLIVALGRRLATEKVGGFFEYANHLLGIQAALKFKKAIENFTSGKIVVGLCPDAYLPAPVCETAFVLAKKFASGIAAKKVSINVVLPETLENAFGGAKIHREIESAFADHGISLIENFPVDDISKLQISAGDKSLDYDLLMLLPPFRGQASVKHLDDSADESLFAKVNHLMQIKNLEHTYAVGDITALPGPKFASAAIQQAETAAANIVSEINGEKPRAELVHNIAKFIDAGGADSIYLHYGIWDEGLYRSETSSMPNWAKFIHERLWKIFDPAALK